MSALCCASALRVLDRHALASRAAQYHLPIQVSSCCTHSCRGTSVVLRIVAAHAGMQYGAGVAALLSQRTSTKLHHDVDVVAVLVGCSTQWQQANTATARHCQLVLTLKGLDSHCVYC